MKFACHDIVIFIKQTNNELHNIILYNFINLYKCFFNDAMQIKKESVNEL